MKGKLHKMESGYILSLNGDIDDPYGIVNKELAEDYEWYKLSLKNCQAIELGYDLDELVENFWKEEFMKPGLIDTNSYKAGFQKALEILGNKKFSEEDIIKAIKLARIKDVNPKNTSAFLTLEDEIIQSLQQTWDVEIEKEFIFDPAMGISQGYYSDKPKLDSEGNLILKRI
jgi:hypothetical protein